MRLLLGALTLGALSSTARAQANDYALRETGREFRGNNRAQAMSVTLREGAASVTTSQLEARLELAGFGRAGHVQSVALRSVSRRKGRVEHDRGAVREWFVNGPEGLQQGFDILRPPRGKGLLVLEISFHGVVPELRSDTRVALLTQGRERLSYDTLRAWDARGKELPARMYVENGRVQLWVDDDGARYPLVVDPYVQIAKLVPTDPNDFNLYGVSMAGEGDTLVLGAMGNTTHGTYAGAVHVLHWNAREWVETAKLYPDAPIEGGYFGADVALSGNTLAVTASKDAPTAMGTVYIFVWDGTQWTQRTSLHSPSPQADTLFGYRIALSGDVMAASEGASVRVFTRSGDDWVPTAQFFPRNADRAAYGEQLALSGDTLIVGAERERAQNMTNGAAYIYRRDTNGVWAEEARLSPLPLLSSRSFGSAVSVQGDRAMVGASLDTSPGGRTGAVYVYERQGSTWHQRSRLTASDSAAIEYFGKSLHFEGDLAVVGSNVPLPPREATGAAYVFARTSNTWVEQVKLTSPDARARDLRASNVLLLDGQIFVSAHMSSQTGVRFSGSVDVFGDRPLEQGDACSQGTGCPSGYCADGVCCNEACDGDPSDCRACSQALTGEPNGVCSPLAEGAACGSASSSQCDAPDSCNATGECEANLAEDGTACEAGDFCSVGDSCAAGTCFEGSWGRCLLAEKCDDVHDRCFPACGDGEVDEDLDEQCDEGTHNSDTLPNRCRTNCWSAYCGDGVRDTREECDLGGANSDSEPNTCRTDCRLPFCGDGVRDSGEGCDEGARNGPDSGATCRAGCVPAECGDGIHDPGEDCDEGPLNSRTQPNACRDNCAKAWCGDGVLDDGEACDHGANNADDMPDRCRTTCRAAHCGDGVLDTDEACEPSRDGALCTDACTWREPEPVADASLPAPDEDAGTKPVVTSDAGMANDHPVEPNGDDTRISAGGCTTAPGTEAPWFLLVQLGGLALLRTARRKAGGRTTFALMAVLLFGGCLDWSTAPVEEEHDDAEQARDGQPDEDGGWPHACPALGDCEARCGMVAVEGCPSYACDPCGDASVCVPEVTCASTGVECGVIDNGCETEVCPDQCEGLRCDGNRCCAPEAIAITCLGACGGTRKNNCDQEISCENPCGPSSSGCTESEESGAALCYCPGANQGETCEQSQFTMNHPTSIVVDAQAGFDYVIDEQRDAVLRFDRATGTRVVFSDDNDQGVQHGIGPGFTRPWALVLDSTGRRLFVSDTGRRAILAVNLDNGGRRTVSDDEDAGVDYGSGPALSNPRGIALDAQRNRLFVVDFPSALFAVDLASGDRTLVSTAGHDGAIVGDGPRLEQAQHVALDPAHGKAYVFCQKSLVSVDLATGDRTLVSTGSPLVDEPGSVRGTGPDYEAENGILQLDRHRALVLDGSRDSMLAIDLTSGDRTVISGLDENRHLVGEGPRFYMSRGMELEPDGRHVLAPIGIFGAILRVDTLTGNRSALYDSSVGTGPGFDVQRSLDLRPSEGIAYVASREKGIVKVDLTTGARSIVVPMQRLGDAVVDASGELAYVLDLEGIVRVALRDGTRTVVSSNANPAHNTMPLIMDVPFMVLDPQQSRVLVVQEDANSVVAVDLSNGLRRLVSGSTRGTGVAVGVPSGAVLDPENDRLFVAVFRIGRIIAIDLRTGNRTIISGSNDAAGIEFVGEGPSLLGPAGIALTEGPGGLYVANDDLLHVDVATGNRTAISMLATDLGVSSVPGLKLLGHGGIALDAEAGFVYAAGGSLIGRFDLATGDRKIVSTYRLW